MHPIHHKESRNARAKALEKFFKHCEEVVYVDAAEYKMQDAFAVAAVDNKLMHIPAASVYGTRPEEAEEATISLQLLVPKQNLSSAIPKRLCVIVRKTKFTKRHLKFY